MTTTRQSFIPLSPSSRPTSPLYTQRSTIRINTTLLPAPVKPPLPTTPKPNFRRSAHMESSHAHAHHASLSAPVTTVDTSPREVSAFTGQVLDRPPTTNLLRPWQRADLVRKSRKLTQLLGETPSPLSVLALRAPGRASSEEPSSRVGRYRPNWASPASTRSTDTIDTLRRHSSPPSPIETLSYVGLWPAGEGGGYRRGKDNERRGNRGRPEPEAGIVIESASFMDLSDDENPSLVHVQSPHFSPSPPPSRPFDSPDFMTPLHSPEDDRRRRREKIAKLHRYLGSRVPTSLVLGPNNTDDALPALDPAIGDISSRHPTRRRSSSAAEFKRNWFGGDDRVKEELDEREKAINVRRAVKMEKMFGEQPPQTLYHTRHSPRPTDRVHSTERPSHTEREAVRPAGRNANQTSYLNKGGKLKRHRAGSHSESIIPLLDSEAPGSPGKRASAVYMHYRYSLDSLSEIIDRDDRESLAELHSILTNDQPGAEGYTTPTREDDAKNVRSERRRSLPTRSSNLSLASQFNLSSPSSPEMASFQARRRQAAKLTHFFGVDYRDLIGDILESIEHDVQEESNRGSLHPEEIQDLLVKLRNLKTKRTAVI
ncbi:hypothetical protein BJY52DRAFT_1185048 [Lactarius psammicola]|nr:hypothetical protein BJY52DRAFT_1185048 [Lactarius psammicola]